MTNFQFLLAYLADLAFGDPRWMPHPVRLFGAAIKLAENVSRRVAHSPVPLRLAGLLSTAIITVAVGVTTSLALDWTARVSSLATSFMKIYFAYTALSIRSLDRAGQEVVECLSHGDIDDARAKLAMIVGRDTAKLDQPEILRAIIETVAENTCDGVVAPMFYLALGGIPATLTYKAINTLDSMIGHKNSRYLYFGWAAARLDDIVNYLPSRLTAVLVAVAAPFLGLSGRKSFQAVARDARLQPSPNSGFPEAAYAGALGVRLGGLNFYGGSPVQKEYLGDPERELSASLYAEVRQLLYVTSALMLIASLGIATIVRKFLWMH